MLYSTYCDFYTAASEPDHNNVVALCQQKLDAPDLHSLPNTIRMNQIKEFVTAGARITERIFNRLYVNNIKS